MSLSAAALRKMIEMGLTLDQAAELAEIWEAGAAMEAAPLSKGALRTRKWREKNVTVTSPETRHGDVSHVGEPTQVVNTTSSSLRSEEALEPISPDGDIPPLKAKCAKPNGFARFWEAYPNKVAKVAAERAYAKALRAIPGPDPPGVILAGVERAKVSRAWGEGFIPHPTTWLNRGSWDDQPAETSPTPRNDNGQRPHPDRQPTVREENLRNLHAGAMAALNRRQSPVG